MSSSSGKTRTKFLICTGLQWLLAGVQKATGCFVSQNCARATTTRWTQLERTALMVAVKESLTKVQSGQVHAGCAPIEQTATEQVPTIFLAVGAL